MDTNRSAASRTRPLALLLLDKASQALDFYMPQILNHAHFVL